MKNTIIKLFIIACLFLNCSGNNELLQSKKDIEIKSFLAFYQQEILKKNSIVLLEDTFDYDYTRCLYTFKQDTSYRNFEEKDFILGQEKRWTKQNMPNYTLISKADLPETITPAGWKNFRKKYNAGYYTLSYPIISNNLKYLVFYEGYYCGGKCGEGKFGLFKKTKTGWRLVKYYCDWVA